MTRVDGQSESKKIRGTRAGALIVIAAATAHCVGSRGEREERRERKREKRNWRGKLESPRKLLLPEIRIQAASRRNSHESDGGAPEVPFSAPPVVVSSPSSPSSSSSSPPTVFHFPESQQQCSSSAAVPAAEKESSEENVATSSRVEPFQPLDTHPDADEITRQQTANVEQKLRESRSARRRSRARSRRPRHPNPLVATLISGALCCAYYNSRAAYFLRIFTGSLCYVFVFLLLGVGALALFLLTAAGIILFARWLVERSCDDCDLDAPQIIVISGIFLILLFALLFSCCMVAIGEYKFRMAKGSLRRSRFYTSRPRATPIACFGSLCAAANSSEEDERAVEGESEVVTLEQRVAALAAVAELRPRPSLLPREQQFYYADDATETQPPI